MKNLGSRKRSAIAEAIVVILYALIVTIALVVIIDSLKPKQMPSPSVIPIPQSSVRQYFCINGKCA